MDTVTISFKLNNRPVAIVASPLENLRDVLREQLQVMAVKAGCGQGGCGSCTVLLNGEPIVSCLMPIANVQGQEITTLEGIGTPMKLHPLQQAFYDNFAAQCGYCSSGMITVAKALLDHNPHPTREQIVDALAGNVCRCTGYLPIIQAIEEVANSR
ncbi:MAG TPA: (2Fe-2S)-binding protein [Anaerolineae bacterium]|nr:(2Fe-2S)-binding protein [Anaerolineae bacterium]